MASVVCGLAFVFLCKAERYSLEKHKDPGLVIHKVSKTWEIFELCGKITFRRNEKKTFCSNQSCRRSKHNLFRLALNWFRPWKQETTVGSIGVMSNKKSPFHYNPYDVIGWYTLQQSRDHYKWSSKDHIDTNKAEKDIWRGLWHNNKHLQIRKITHQPIIFAFGNWVVKLA